MAGRDIIFVCCVFLFSGIQCSWGQSKCRRFEAEVDCIDFCNTCEPDDCSLPAARCVPGCDCIPGFSRDITGRCIPQELCGRETAVQGRLLGTLNAGASGCPNERLCVRRCKERLLKDGICLGPDREFCNCFTTSNRPF